MTKKGWLETAVNRTDAGDWDYSKMTKTICEMGGGENFISKVFNDGFEIGVITTLTLTFVVGGCFWGACKYMNYKKWKLEEEYHEEVQDEERIKNKE